MSSVLPLAALLAFVAGFALQRGQICAVIAVREGVEHGRWSRFLSFLECSAWALGLILLASVAGVMRIETWPEQVSLAAAAAGGALFGAGALVNGACAFGSAGRLGAGETSFLAFIPGFVLGAAGASALGVESMPATMMRFGLVPAVYAALAIALTAFALWRLISAWRAAPGPFRMIGAVRRMSWPPPLAMAVMAFASVGLLLLVFAWPYTTLLVDLALHRGTQTSLRMLLALVFLGGAFVGALTARRFKLRTPSLRGVVARLFGGALMGFGAALIPGGNDALVLMGLPLLQPAAFVAYAAMVAVIAAGFLARRALAALRHQPTSVRDEG